MDLLFRVRRASFGRRLRTWKWKREWAWFYWPNHIPETDEPRAFRYHAVRLKLASFTPFEAWFNGPRLEGGFALMPSAHLGVSWSYAGFGVSSVNYRRASWKRLRIELALLNQHLSLEVHVPIWGESVEEHLHNKELDRLRWNSFHEAMEADGCQNERTWHGNYSPFITNGTGTRRNTVGLLPDGSIGVVEERYVTCRECKREHVVPPEVVEIFDRPFRRESRNEHDAREAARKARYQPAEEAAT